MVEEDAKDNTDEFFDVEETGNGSDGLLVLPAFSTADFMSDSASLVHAQVVRRTELPKPRTEFKVW